MPTVYLLYSEKLRKHYIGSTDDPKRRLAEHNSGRGGRFTRAANDWRLVHTEECETMSAARSREALIKLRPALRREFYAAGDTVPSRRSETL